MGGLDVTDPPDVAEPPDRSQPREIGTIAFGGLSEIVRLRQVTRLPERCGPLHDPDGNPVQRWQPLPDRG